MSDASTMSRLNFLACSVKVPLPWLMYSLFGLSYMQRYMSRSPSLSMSTSVDPADQPSPPSTPAEVVMSVNLKS